MNIQQQFVFDKVREGKNVFLTGEPGTGKSYTVHHIIQWAIRSQKHIGVTAMTGVAAVLIDGVTLHSYLGIGLGTDDLHILVTKAFKNSKLRRKLTQLEILIIDEISMMNHELMGKVSRYLSSVRHKDLPFGGVQLICVGDFSQLAPCDGEYCFRGKTWKSADFEHCILTESIRHNDDTEFQDMLKRLRWGRCSDEDYERLLQLQNTEFPENIIPTRLYSLNVNVDKINNDELAKLITHGARTITYRIRFPHEINKTECLKYAKALNISDITLCIGSQVVLTRNLNQDIGLVNGARGVITQIHPEFVMVEFLNGTGPERIDFYKLSLINIWEKNKTDSNDDDIEERKVEFNIYSIPLKLAWAITIHRTIGMTLDAVEIDLGNSIFADGQAYTAISRARNLRSIRIISVNKSSFKTNPRVIKFYNKLLSQKFH